MKIKEFKNFFVLVLMLYSIKVNAYDFEVNGLCYNILTSNTVEVTYRTSQHGDYSGHLVVPNSVNYNNKTYTVTAISGWAFYKCSGCTEIVLPQTIKTIGWYAFNGCTGLVDFTVPTSIETIGQYAFENCTNLEFVNITDIAAWCKIKFADITSNPTFNSHRLFLNRDEIINLKIPDSITTIGDNAFISCENISSVLIPNGITSIGNYVFSGCSGLSSVTISNSVTSIGIEAFSGCGSLKVISIPDKITSIRKGTFEGCERLTNLTIPNSVVSIEDFAFNGCSNLASVSLSKNLSSIGEYAFRDCYSITSIIIPSSLASIGHSAFMGCKGLTSIVAESGNAKFDSRDDCNAIIETETNTLVLGCMNTIIPNSVACIGGWAFDECIGLTSITIPYSVTSIEEGAFYKCSKIRSITIPGKVNNIGRYAFRGCSNLSSVSSEILNPFNLSTLVFEYISSDAILHVPKGTKDLYEEKGWSQFFTKVIEDVTTTASYTLSVSATGNGSATYSGTTIRNQTRSFTVNEGTSATVSFTPDSGQRIASVKVNNTDVTANVTNNKYTISNIKANTTLSVTFEAIPPTTYTLSIQATGNGSATYSGTTIRNQTRSFTVSEGTSATFSFTPDSGQRIASVKVNNTDVTASVTNNKYTISNIKANTNLYVTFEANQNTPFEIPSFCTVAAGETCAFFEAPSTWTETVMCWAWGTQNYTGGNWPGQACKKLGTASNGNSVWKWTYTGTLTTQPTTIIFSNNGAPQTEDLQFKNGGYYSKDGLQGIVTATPATTYSLNITASGSGSATFSGTTIRNQTRSFSVNEGTSATVSFTPDSGQRIASVKVNNTDVTANVTNNKYTISNIKSNTTLSVTFEAIKDAPFEIPSFCTVVPGETCAFFEAPTTWTETIMCYAWAGSLDYTDSYPGQACKKLGTAPNGNSVWKWTYTGTLTTQPTNIIFSNNGTFQATTLVFKNCGYYTKDGLKGVVATMNITASGNGSVIYSGTTIRNQTRSFGLNEGASATMTFSPDSGNSLASVKVDSQDVTASVANYQYTISSIASDTNLEVTFEEMVNALVNEDVNYSVASHDDKTVRVSAGKYGLILTVPATFVKNGVTWTVTGIETNALKDNADLAAIVWNPNAAFTATVSNPNLLLYVKDVQYAPEAVKNVVVNGTANSITLVDAENGNNFYCPQQFLARNISYIHHYGMATGIGESRGWETISLPFDVQTVTHATKGSIVPFKKWASGDTEHPFWLYELNGTGWTEAQGIKAYTPYIISMPNNSKYKSQFQLAGNVTFAAANVTVGKTEDLHTATYSGRTFTPTFSMRENGEGLYALNVNNDFIVDNSGMTEGSRFVLNMRKVHPFEAYMTTASQARQFFEVFETGTEELEKLNVQQLDYCYDLAGRKIVNSKSPNSKMPKGVYIMNGEKIIIK